MCSPDGSSKSPEALIVGGFANISLSTSEGSLHNTTAAAQIIRQPGLNRDGVVEGIFPVRLCLAQTSSDVDPFEGPWQEKNRRTSGLIDHQSPQWFCPL